MYLSLVELCGIDSVSAETSRNLSFVTIIIMSTVQLSTVMSVNIIEVRQPWRDSGAVRHISYHPVGTSCFMEKIILLLQGEIPCIHGRLSVGHAFDPCYQRLSNQLYVQQLKIFHSAS